MCHFIECFGSSNWLELGVEECVLGVVITSPESVSGCQSCPTLRDPMDCSPSGFSVHGIL